MEPVHQSRRRKTPWIIGGIVLVGVGMVVWGNWTRLLFEFRFGRYAELQRENENNPQISEADAEAEEVLNKALVEMGPPIIPFVLQKFDQDDKYAKAGAYILNALDQKGFEALLTDISTRSRNVRFWAAKMTSHHMRRDVFSTAYPKGWQAPMVRGMTELLYDRDGGVKLIAARALKECKMAPENLAPKIEAILRYAEDNQ